jgi:hypothetical protein
MRFRKCAFEKALNGWIISIVWLCLIVASFLGCSNSETDPPPGVVIDISPDRIDIQAPGFKGGCKRCPK